MSKFNLTGLRRKAARSAIHSDSTSSGVTYEGAPGYARDTKGELFLLAVTNLVGEGTFYEAATDRDARFAALVRELAVTDPDWTTRLIGWLRTGANLRSASLVAATEFVAARLAAGIDGGNRAVIGSVLQRADEPGELLAYWLASHGRAVPKPVKRGVADATARLYTERSLLKWDSALRSVRFGDVVELTHPTPVAAWQNALFRYAIDRRHDRTDTVPAELATISARAELMALPVLDRRAALADPQRLAAAGMTWESLAGWLQGPLDATAWQAVIGSMGYMALLRNLRNFDDAGVPDHVAEQVAARLADPAEVAKARQLPMRFLSAYRAPPSLRWAAALERALAASLANVPSLEGQTLVLVDRSGSMFGPVSERSELTRADAAAVFGTALAVRAASADLAQFGTGSAPVRFRLGESVLRVLDRFGQLGGTNTAEAVRRHYRGHDRVVIVTDEQARFDGRGSDPTRAVPTSVPVYTWNLAGYRYGHAPSGGALRHVFGGLTDAGFGMIPLLEAGRDGCWPF
ncbi:MAG: TROVE domain-containing protein [Actinomycetota bacterium]|nr:TROVE domain-containing protein [Actinomycetota bacterium]MDQ2956437.1 TROVE domain-containing protein [Actinomycetota bacterium]